MHRKKVRPGSAAKPSTAQGALSRSVRTAIRCDGRLWTVRQNLFDR